MASKVCGPCVHLIIQLQGLVQRKLSIILHLGCVGSRKGYELRWHIVGYR